MHAVFMANGKRRLVDELFKWLETKMFFLPFENPKNYEEVKDKDGNVLKEGKIPIEADLRYGLFGSYEFVFPKNHMNEVLTTLQFHKPIETEMKYEGVKGLAVKARLLALRQALKCEPIPKFETDKMLFLPEKLMDNIRIFPIGVRYDPIREVGDHGMIHEAI